MKFVGFLSEVCWISQRSLLDLSVKFVGFPSEVCWIYQIFLDLFLTLFLDRFFLDLNVQEQRRQQQGRRQQQAGQGEGG